MIYAERFEDDVHWHPQCFICTECSNILVDLIYFKHGADIFCGRHHAEKFKPRCAKCDEVWIISFLLTSFFSLLELLKIGRN